MSNYLVVLCQDIKYVGSHARGLQNRGLQVVLLKRNARLLKDYITHMQHFNFYDTTANVPKQTSVPRLSTYGKQILKRSIVILICIVRVRYIFVIFRWCFFAMLHELILLILISEGGLVLVYYFLSYVVFSGAEKMIASS